MANTTEQVKMEEISIKIKHEPSGYRDDIWVEERFTLETSLDDTIHKTQVERYIDEEFYQFKKNAVTHHLKYLIKVINQTQ